MADLFDLFDDGMTETEFIKANGDDSTGFAVTRADLTLLAHKLAGEVLRWNFFLRLNVCLSHIDARDYLGFRLGRVLDYLPDLRPEIEETMRLGERENDIAAQEVIDEWESNARMQKTDPPPETESTGWRSRESKAPSE
jgi:hypothetical protein